MNTRGRGEVWGQTWNDKIVGCVLVVLVWAGCPLYMVAIASSTGFHPKSKRISTVFPRPIFVRVLFIYARCRTSFKLFIGRSGVVVFPVIHTDSKCRIAKSSPNCIELFVSEKKGREVNTRTI